MSRQSFTRLQSQAKDLIQQSSGNLASSTIANFIKNNLNSGAYHIQTNLRGYINQDIPMTTPTVANQQYYHYPPGVTPPIESATWTVSSIPYPLTVIQSQKQWDEINEITFSGTSIPQYIFPRLYDFGLYPTPASAGETITLVTTALDADMSAEDYVTGTVTVTNDSQTITGSGTTWTSAMVGRWFVLTDSNGNPKDHWYRLSTFSSVTEMILQSYYEQGGLSGETYIIGQTPAIPVELHELLPHYVAYKFFSGPRKDMAASKMHKNIFEYNDPKPNYKQIKYPTGGLMGAIRRYSSRDNSAIVMRGVQTGARFDDSHRTLSS